jgi:hypothetical protein
LIFRSGNISNGERQLSDKQLLRVLPLAHDKYYENIFWTTADRAESRRTRVGHSLDGTPYAIKVTE